MWQDRTNASFEYVGVIASLLNILALIQDAGRIAGVSVTSSAFFFAWGLSNLYYYRHLSQRASAIASLGLVLSNGTWLSLVLAYRTGML